MHVTSSRLALSIIAFVLCGAGVVCGGLALSSHTTGDARTAQRGAVFWAALCAIAIAGYHLAYKAALETGARRLAHSRPRRCHDAP